MNILSKTEIEALFYYDGSNLVNKFTRGLAKKDGIAGSVNSKGYIHIRVNNKFYLAHRLIWVLHDNLLSDKDFVDHRNRIKTDNKIDNLRIATVAQNNINRGVLPSNTSGRKNIYYSRYHDRWVADISINGKSIKRYRPTKEDAVMALEGLRKEYPDEFAN